MAEKILVNRTIIRTLFLNGSVLIDAIDVINYLTSEQDIKKIKERIVELNNDILKRNGVTISLQTKEK